MYLAYLQRVGGSRKMFGKGRTSQNRHVLITLIIEPIRSLPRRDVGTLSTDHDQLRHRHVIYILSAKWKCSVEMIKRWWSEHQRERCVVMTCCYTQRPRNDRQRSLRGTTRNRARRCVSEDVLRQKLGPESARPRHTASGISCWPQGADWFSDNAREGAAGQEIRRDDKVVEAAAQKRNEMRPSGVCATPASQSSALTSNGTMYLALKYRVHRATTFASLWRLKLFCRSDAQIAVASTADCLLLARGSFKQGKA